jgi:hypothetical protein
MGRRVCWTEAVAWWVAPAVRSWLCRWSAMHAGAVRVAAPRRWALDDTRATQLGLAGTWGGGKLECRRGWTRRVQAAGTSGVVRKIIHFGQKRSPSCDLYGRSTFLVVMQHDGGSGVRGKAGPNWVRKVFNCLPFL